ncbi:N-acetyl-gamma-glutamyl-phosphate reductase [Corynebacterium tapiri]
MVFLALPHGHSAELAQQLDASTTIVDCAADFRLESAEQWQKYYQSEHAGTWPYGLPEMPGNRERIATSTRVAIPGCFPTGATLATLPAVQAGLVEPHLTITSVTGVSGAGKKAQVSLLGAETMSNAKAYSVAGQHRHTPEIKQNLQAFTKDSVSINFTPVLAPMPRGILTVASAPVKPGTGAEDVRRAYKRAYASETFVALLPLGQQPQTQHVLGSNLCHVQVELDETAGTVVMTSAIDNLTKGTAGAAVQCMNLVRGFDEAAGLPLVGLAP